MKKAALIVSAVIFSIVLAGGQYSTSSQTGEISYHLKLLEKLHKLDTAEQASSEAELPPLEQTKQSSWVIEVVDSAGDVGMYSSLAIDSDRNLHIAYYDYSNTALKYATNKNGTWEIFTVDSADVVGEFSSIAVDSEGNAHIAYYYCGTYGDPWCLVGDLRYATNKNGTWEIFTIEATGNVGLFAAIAVDSDDNVHIAYHDETDEPLTKSLKYATNAGGSWQIFTIDASTYSGHGVSIAADSNDKIHISHIDAQGGSGLKYATNAGGSWQSTMVYSIGGDSDDDFTSIAVDASGHVHIAFWDWSDKDLVYATNAGGSWQIQSIAGGGFLENAGEYPSIAVDASGHVHISYFDPELFGGSLKYITNANGSWTIEEIDTSGDAGYFTSIEVTPYGSIYISYYDNDAEDLKLAKKEVEEPPDDDTDDDITDDDIEDDDIVDDDVADDDSGGEQEQTKGQVAGCGCAL